MYISILKTKKFAVGIDCFSSCCLHTIDQQKQAKGKCIKHLTMAEQPGLEFYIVVGIVKTGFWIMGCKLNSQFSFFILVLARRKLGAKLRPNYASLSTIPAFSRFWYWCCAFRFNPATPFDA